MEKQKIKKSTIKNEWALILALVLIVLLLCLSCTVVKNNGRYPKAMKVDTKIKDSIYWHYLDGNYDFYIKSRRFQEGDSIIFDRIGKKYIIVKRRR